MNVLHIHSVDIPQPYFATAAGTSAAPSSSSSSSITELKCAVHFFRSLSPSAGSITSPSSRSTALFIVAVPNYLSPEDFLLFCGTEVDHFSELCFLRNDGMEDRYSVLITLANQLSADGFYCNFNGKRFRPSEAEVCHIYFTQSARCYEFAEEANSVPPGFVELPTCPVCLERLDQDTSGIQTTLCDHSFQCPCVLKWTYLSCQVCRLCQQQDEKPSCVVCGTLKNLWVCVICGFVGCGRYEERHAIRHWKDTQHCYSLGLEKQQVWDYVGDSYVHRLNQSKADGKSVMANSSCMSHHGECGTCGCSEDSGIGGALFDSRVEAVRRGGAYSGGDGHAIDDSDVEDRDDDLSNDASNDSGNDSLEDGVCGDGDHDTSGGDAVAIARVESSADGIGGEDGNGGGVIVGVCDWAILDEHGGEEEVTASAIHMATSEVGRAHDVRTVGRDVVVEAMAASADEVATDPIISIVAAASRCIDGDVGGNGIDRRVLFDGVPESDIPILEEVLDARPETFKETLTLGDSMRVSVLNLLVFFLKNIKGKVIRDFDPLSVKFYLNCLDPLRTGKLEIMWLANKFVSIFQRVEVTTNQKILLDVRKQQQEHRNALESLAAQEGRLVAAIASAGGDPSGVVSDFDFMDADALQTLLYD